MSNMLTHVLSGFKIYLMNIQLVKLHVNQEVVMSCAEYSSDMFHIQMYRMRPP